VAEPGISAAPDLGKPVPLARDFGRFVPTRSGGQRRLTTAAWQVLRLYPGLRRFSQRFSVFLQGFISQRCFGIQIAKFKLEALVGVLSTKGAP